MALKRSGSFSEQSRRSVAWQALVSVVGLIISVRMFYPGLMSNDSVDQYSQALRYSFTDWHPPIMAFVWALINDWIPGPFGMLLLFCSMYWGGLFLLSLSIPRANKVSSVALIALGFAPFAIGSLGSIWKDVFHAVFTLFAVGLLSINSRSGERERNIVRIAAVILLFLAAMARFNALAALPPLLWLAIGRPQLKSWRGAAALTLLPLSVLLLSSVFNYGFLRAERTGVYSSLLIFDLGAITDATGVNAFGQSFKPEEEQKLKSKCYDTGAWDSYAWGACAFFTPAVKASGLWGSSALFHAWANAVENHPVEYVKHRFNHWWRLLWNPQSFLISQMQTNQWGFEFKESALHLSLERTTELMQHGIFFKPGFWFLLAIALIIVTFRRGAGPSREIAIALNVSSSLYILSYLPAGVATDFRYAYWSILATWISLPLVYASLRQVRMNVDVEADAKHITPAMTQPSK